MREAGNIAEEKSASKITLPHVAEAMKKDARAREDLHAEVVVVGNNEATAGNVNAQRTGILKLGERIAMLTEHYRKAPAALEPINPVRARVHNINPPRIGRDFDVSGPNKCNQRYARAEVADPSEGGVVNSDPGLIAIRHEVPPVRMDGHPDRAFRDGPGSNQRPVGMESRDVVQVRIGNKDSPIDGDCNPGRAA